MKEKIVKGEVFYYFETKEEAVKFKTDNQFYCLIWKGAAYYACVGCSIILVEQHIQNMKNHAKNLLEKCEELGKHFA